MHEPLEELTNALVDLRKAYQAKNRNAAAEALHVAHAKARKALDWRVLRINMQDASDRRPVHRRERQKARDLQKSIIQNTQPVDLVRAAFGREYEAVRAFCCSGQERNEPCQ